METQSSGMPERFSAVQQGRLYYLDWLRILAILAVFVLHTAKIFDFHTIDLYNPVRSPFWSALREGILLWVMPLFFVISGAAVCFSLQPGRAWLFMKSRIRRILLPLALVGTFLVNPVYVYALRLFQGKTVDNFFSWYPHFFGGVFGFGGNFAPLGHGTHLWYLEFLLVYSLILLPLFIRSQKRMAQRGERISHGFENPWLLLLLFVPISVAGAGFVLMGLGWVRVMGGWDPISYLLFFGYGFVLFSNQRILEMVKRLGPVFLTAAVVLTALFIDSHFGFNLIIPGVTRHDMSAGGALRPLEITVWAGVQAFRGLVAWCWILGLLGTGARLLNTNSRVLAYGNEAVLPFYILHHSVILLVGAWVVGLSIGVQAKFTLILGISFVIIMALYELLVRRVIPLRLLFGMKAKGVKREAASRRGNAIIHPVGKVDKTI